MCWDKGLEVNRKTARIKNTEDLKNYEPSTGFQ